MVTVRTSDGKTYTNPKDVHIPRNEKTESFYRMVLEHDYPEKKTKDETA